MEKPISLAPPSLAPPLLQQQSSMASNYRRSEVSRVCARPRVARVGDQKPSARCPRVRSKAPSASSPTAAITCGCQTATPTKTTTRRRRRHQSQTRR
eukprot:1477606-Prymnesium_polylepis.1